MLCSLAYKAWTLGMGKGAGMLSLRTACKQQVLQVAQTALEN